MKGGPLGEVGGPLRTGRMAGGRHRGRTEIGDREAPLWFHAAARLPTCQGLKKRRLPVREVPKERPALLPAVRSLP